MSSQYPRFQLTEKQRLVRKRYLVATLITCIAAAMVFGALHVVKLGSNRMADMRAKASYDLKDEHKRIRAAGEDIILQQRHESQEQAEETYALTEVNALISDEQWKEIESMVKIASGPFVMGSNSDRTDIQNRPEHNVNLKAFLIDKYPTTNVEYAKYISQTKYRPPLDWKNGQIPDNKLLHPVTMVSWFDAKKYCEFLGKRLPTEEEWEKAARGPSGNRWPWGNEMNTNNLNTYYNVGATTSVVRYESGKSYYGIYDMAGNVSEWTASEFLPYEGSTAPKSLFAAKTLVSKTPEDSAMKIGEFVELKDRVFRVRRGGSWKSDPFSTSSYHRNFSMPHYASDFFGFRCAKDIE